MNKAVWILLLCYALLQSSCSDMVFRTVRVGDKKMQIGFQRVMPEIDQKHNTLNKRRLGKDEMKFWTPQNGGNSFNITLPKSPADTVAIIESRTSSGDFSVDYNLGKITKAALKHAVRTKLKGNLNLRMLKLQVVGDTCATVIWYERNVLSLSRNEVCQIIDLQPNNTKVVLEIIFVNPLPPKVIGSISNLCVLTLID